MVVARRKGDVKAVAKWTWDEETRDRACLNSPEKHEKITPVVQVSVVYIRKSKGKLCGMLLRTVKYRFSLFRSLLHTKISENPGWKYHASSRLHLMRHVSI